MSSTLPITNTTAPTTSNEPSQFFVWLLGLTFVTVISLCSVVGIFLMRCMKKSLYNWFITFFVSVGVGALSGSAAFHFLPHAFGHHEDESHDHHDDELHLLHDDDHHDGSHAHHHHHDDLNKSFAILAGVYIFFFCDKFAKILLEMRRKRINFATDTTTASVPIEDPSKLHEQSIEQQSHALCVHDHEYREGDSVIATVAWMIIFGDGLHNFMDGVVIGASFTESLLRGISASVVVLCEEFPHELGDVAILVNSGMTMKQAFVYNLLSALTCYVGFFIGVFVGNILDSSFDVYTHAFVGGMFLYISLACMMPEMKNAMEKALTVSFSKGLELLGMQAIGLFTGLFCMFVMARYGDRIDFA